MSDENNSLRDPDKESEARTRSVQEGAGGDGAFDPTPYLRRLRGRGGGQEYLDVKWRLLWLRREHPDAEIVTEHIRIGEDHALFKATVTLPAGGKATGYGSETVGDFADFIEKAETKAIGRALNALGYGTQFADLEDESGAAAGGDRFTALPATPGPEPDVATPAPSYVDALRSAARTPEPAPERRASEPIALDRHRERVAPETADAEPALEDYSWTAFWKWARELGYSSQGAIRELIGRSVEGLSPAEVRDLVRQARESD